MKIDISIIIATFNSEKTLRYALESVINQSFQNWECIIIDGASKDDTIEIVKDFKNRDNRFRYISEPDKGIYDAFNKGWKIARGEWIYYLGSDDLITRDGLQCLFSAANSFDIIYGDMNYATGFGQKSKVSIPENKLIGNMPCHQSMIMKRSLIQKLNGFDMNRYRICADFDLFQRAIKDGATIKHITSIVACFNSQGVSSRISIYMKECYNIKREYSGLSSAFYYVISEYIRRSLKNIYLRIRR